MNNKIINNFNSLPFHLPFLLILEISIVLDPNIAIHIIPHSCIVLLLPLLLLPLLLIQYQLQDSPQVLVLQPLQIKQSQLTSLSLLFHSSLVSLQAFNLKLLFFRDAIITCWMNIHLSKQSFKS